MSAAVGVIGAGAIARMVHLPVLAAMPEAHVAWVADADEARARAVAASFRVPHVALEALDDALGRCDVALLAIPVTARASHLERLARHETAVLVEKPFARTRAEHGQILARFPAHRIAGGFMRRTYASTLLARRLVDERWLGPLERVRIAEGGRTTKTGVDASAFDDPHGAGGVLLDLGCHALDVVLEVTRARGHQLVSQRMVLDGRVDRRAEGELLLETPACDEPVPVEYVFSWLDPQDNAVELVFERARLVLSARPEQPVTLAGRSGRGEPLQLVAPAGGALTSAQAFYLEWRWFLDGLASGVPSPLAAASCTAVTALVEALYDAARDAR